MNKLSDNPGFCFPGELIANLSWFPSRHAIPCSVLVNNDTRGGIVMIFDPSDLKFFGVSPSGLPEPTFRFRMISTDQKAFAIEIHLGFDNERMIRIQLNPGVAPTKEFLKLCLKTKMISIHYYCMKKKFFGSTLTSLCDEHVGWFKRNHELATKFSQTNDYQSVCRAMSFGTKSNERIYQYFEKKGIDCFIREGSIVAKFIDNK